MGSFIHVPRPHYKKPPESTSERGTVRSTGRGKVAATNIYAAGEAFRTIANRPYKTGAHEVSEIPAAVAAGYAERERWTSDFVLCDRTVNIHVPYRIIKDLKPNRPKHTSNC